MKRSMSRYSLIIFLVVIIVFFILILFECSYIKFDISTSFIESLNNLDSIIIYSAIITLSIRFVIIDISNIKESSNYIPYKKNSIKTKNITNNDLTANNFIDEEVKNATDNDLTTNNSIKEIYDKLECINDMIGKINQATASILSEGNKQYFYYTENNNIYSYFKTIVYNTNESIKMMQNNFSINNEILLFTKDIYSKMEILLETSKSNMQHRSENIAFNNSNIMESNELKQDKPPSSISVDSLLSIYNEWKNDCIRDQKHKGLPKGFQYCILSSENNIELGNSNAPYIYYQAGDVKYYFPNLKNPTRCLTICYSSNKEIHENYFYDFNIVKISQSSNSSFQRGEIKIL